MPTAELVHLVKTACLPAKVYLGLYIVVVAFNLFENTHKNKYSTTTTLIGMVFLALIGFGIFWFDNYLCSYGYEKIVWVLVLIIFVNLVNKLRKLL
jgi:hypothetical protein